MTTVYLALGSNLGRREGNLRRARAMLAPDIIVGKVSPTYETEPMYAIEQPRFLNAVCEAETELSASEVLKKIKSIEKEIGEHKHNGPRIIDIDMLFYGAEVIETPGLQVPHPRIAERAFVLVPMSDIAPNFTHPILGSTIVELRDQLGAVSGLQRI